MGIEKPKGKNAAEVVKDTAKEQLGELQKTLKFEHQFPLGKSQLPDKKQKEADKLGFESGKLYHFEGTVDRVPFKASLKPVKFYREQASFARQILEDFDHVKISFPSFKGPSGKARAREILQYLADSVPVDSKAPFDAKKWKADTDLKYGVEQVYGAEGIFNLILSYKRAVDKMRSRVKEVGANTTFELRLSNREASERSIRVFEVNKLVEKVLQESVLSGDTGRQVFNKYMTEFAAQRYQLVLKIGASKRDGVLFSDYADALMKKLNALDCHDVGTAVVSYEDYERMQSISDALDAAENDFKKEFEKGKATLEKKSVAPAAAEEPRQSVAAREHARRIESILNQGDILDRYEIDERNVEATVKRVVEDVLRACRVPVQFNLKTLADLKIKLGGIVRARINSAVSGGVKEINFDAQDKKTLVEIVLRVLDYEKDLQGAAKTELLRDQMRGIGY